MSRNPATFAKRQRELDKQEKRQEKARKRANRRSVQRPDNASGEDPDIAGIVPGPQPSPWGDEDLLPDDSEDEEVENSARLNGGSQ